MTNLFAHLHVHTEYSPLDGMSKIEDLILKAKEMGQQAIAITDHGSSSGLYEAYWLGQEHRIKVLLGSEFYFEGEGDKKKSGHLILLAKNETGLQNIFQLQSKAYMENFYYKPRINFNMLKEHREGLICLSACMANTIAQNILANEKVLALKHLHTLKEIFEDDFYLELQSSTMEEQVKINKQYEEWNKDGFAKIVLTNDVHYTNKDDSDVHEVLLAIQQNKKMNDPKRWKFQTQDFWLKSWEEMLEYVPYLKKSTIDSCLSSINEIVEKCNVEICTDCFLPTYMGMTKEEEDAMLDDLVTTQYIDRVCARGESNNAFYQDVLNELQVIKETGYSGYFLIVQEYANWAKRSGILVGDGRGSGAGSKVAYVLGITEINPQRYGLLFERFLSVGREPDFDIDFSDINAVFKHLQDTYGMGNVARVGAYNRMTAKSALRKVLAIFNQTQANISKIVGLLPQRLHFTFEEALSESSELREFFDEHKDWYRYISRLENVMSHMSTHAGGVIIFPNMNKYLPIMRDKDDDTKMVVGLDKKTLEKLGHYKFDILGLNSLTLLDQTIKFIGEEFDWTTIDFEDQKVYDMLCKGDVLGVFQLSDQKEKIMQQQPRCFEDLIAINALIRPGVGDWDEYINRRRTGIYQGKDETPYLNSTSGIIVYQEQYLLLANTYAGWDIAYSDKHIRKNKDICNDEELRSKFYHDSAARGYEPYDIQDVWDDICSVVSAGYGFNRSHSTSYARLSFQTAFLKYYYPVEFYAALLTMDGGDVEKILRIKEDTDRLGIKILHPDINMSDTKFIPVEDNILFPLTSIIGVGGSTMYEINRMKPIQSFVRFMQERVAKFVRINVIENLIKSGCFDFTGKSRHSLLTQLGQMTDREVDTAEKTIHQYERDSMGFYLTGSPYDQYATPVWDEVPEGSNISNIGEVVDLAVRYDKRGNEMAFLTLANKGGSFRGIAFSSQWSEMKEVVIQGSLLVVRGRKDKGALLINSAERM